MLETKKLFAVGLALAGLATTGCYDFDTAFTDCVGKGRCNPPPGTCNPALPDLPDEDFVDANCDGVDGDADAGFFVDPVAGNNVNPGTLKEPFRTLAHALPFAADAGKVLYLAQGTYNEPALRLERPVSLYGGYSRGEDGGWARGDGFDTRINGGPIGLTVSGLEDTALILEQLHITSTMPSDAGAPSIGLRVLGSTGVQLRRVTVEAGRGADGLPSNPAVANPLAGADGGPGQTTTDITDETVRADGGSPGVNNCGPGIRGGSGGQGGIASNQPTPGEAGIPSADGGTAGRNLEVEAKNCTTTPCQCNGVAGDRGQDGAEGGAGTDGTPGDGTGQQKGDSWVANAGGGGGPGHPGGGGGGGGGGGYCLSSGARLVPSKGGGGGGGGAGGCPGVGAVAGGGGGGASIAVLLVNGRVELVSSTLRTAGGGQGGAGGRGSNGGPGGNGGLGAAGYPQWYESTSGGVTYRQEATGGTGGNGGNGGPGGRGGHGGNGGGGPSVGLWCGSGSSFTQRGAVFDLGDGGLPGNGPNPKSTPGIKEEQYGCQ